MSKKFWQRVFSFIVLAGMVLSLTVPGTAQARTPATSLAAPAIPEDPLAKIEQQVVDEITANGQADFFIMLKEQADLSSADSLATKVQKGEFVYNTLRATAERTQKSLLAYLDQQGASYRPFYIINAVLVRGGTQELLMAVAARTEVGRVTANKPFQLEKPMIKDVGPQAPNAVETNITFVNADDVWAMGITGAGVLLAGNDTGLEWDHPAIIGHYRGWDGANADHNYNWWDATGANPTVPYDGYGHGTHTTGTMVGDDGVGNQIGMAPGSQTIHCRNMDSGGGGQTAWFIECFEWDLAPWDLSGGNARPDLAPDAVNNSWGFWGGGDESFRTAIANLQAAGILVEVSAGNEGPGCTTLRSPADYQEVLTTGSVQHSGGVLPGTITGFSSRGPSSLDGDYFPDVMAPGENIRSSVPGGIYQGGWSGTSMAGPHVVGLIGLMWSANPALRGLIEPTVQIMIDTAVPLTGQQGSSCGGEYNEGPNNDWGYGTIDSLAAVQMALAFGGVGTLEGTVTDDDTGAFLQGVHILASLSPTQSFQTATDPDGFYSTKVFSGTYDVSASYFGYYPETVPGVYVGEDMTTTLDFALEAAPSSVLTVTVVDANTGWPLYASATLGGTPYPAKWTDPVTGQFVVTIPDGTNLILGVDAWTPGYLHQDVALTVSGDANILVELEADELTCNAPGYTASGGVFASFNSGNLPAGWAVVNNGGTCEWEFDDPYGDGNNTGGSGLFADADSNACGSGSFMDTELRTPIIDFTGVPSVTLEFKYDYWNLGDTADVDVSNDSGATWTNVWTRTSDDRGPQTAILDISALAGNQNDVMVRWHYYDAYWAWYWQVDDVSVGEVVCTPPAGGGLVVGNVYDTNENNPLPGATVENDSGFATLTAPTVDPMVDDAFYTIYSPGGTHLFMASLQDYGPDLAVVNVEDGNTIERNFFLPAGHLAFDPLDMHVTLDMGDSATLPLTITNDGDAAATFAIGEIDQGFDPVVLAYNPPAQSAGSAVQLMQFGKAEASGKVAPLAPAADILLNQAPNQVNGLFADSDCALCGTGQQSIAENFALPDGATIGQIVFWTGYYPADVPQEPDEITVIFHADQGGAPGAVLASETPVAYERAQTGVILFGVHEWVHTLTLASPVSLDPGIYWVEIFNATTGNSDQFFWETGNLDPVYGLAGSAWTTATPGSSWNYDSATELSIQLLTGSGDVPWLSEDPITGTVPAAALVNVAGLVEISAEPGPLATSVTAKEYLHSAAIAANPQAVLWDQLPPSGTSFAAQDFEPSYDVYDIYAADDFTNATAWTVGKITTMGGWGTPKDLLNASALHWFIYADNAGVPAGVPGDATEFWSLSLAPTDPQVQLSVADFSDVVLTLDTPITLPAGNWWLVYYISLEYDSYGQYGWQGTTTPVYGSVGRQNNPGGGFGIGTGWVTNTFGSDFAFRLEEPATLGNVVVDVTFDAGVPEITQPGDYFAALRISSDTPYAATTIPVTMTVIPPATYGKLQGTVEGLGYCDLELYPLEEAVVYIESSSGMTWTLETDEFGYYQIWMDAANSPLTINVSAADHGSVAVSGVIISPGGAVTVQDFALRWLKPCVSAVPDDMAVTVDIGASATLTMTVSNAGAAATDFKVTERDRGYSPTAMGWIEYLPEVAPTGAAQAAHNGPLQEGVASRRPYIFHGNAPQAANIIVYCDDDQHSPTFVEQALMDMGLTYTFYGNPSDPGDLDLFTQDVNAGGWDLVILAQDGWIYLDAREYTAVENHILAGGSAVVYSWGIGYDAAQYGHTLWATMGTDYVSWLQSPEDLYWWDDGHPIFTGVPEFTDLTDLSYLAYGAKMNVIDGVAEGLGGFSTSPEDGQGGVILSENFKTLYRGLSDNLNDGDEDSDGAPDAYEFWLSGLDFMLNPSVDVIWLSEAPITGTLPADTGVQDIAVTFDSSVVPQPGVYFATLSVKTDDPVFTPMLPVTMTVNPTADYGILVGNVTSLGYCDDNPAPLEGATILIEAATGVTYTVETDADGDYSRWLKVSEGPYIVSVIAAEHEFDLVSGVVITSLGTTTIGFELRWLEPCVVALPSELVVDVALGYERTVVLDLINGGAVSTDFKITEKEGTVLPAGKPAPEGANTSVAPAGYVPRLTQSSYLPAAPAEGLVAVFKDADPWGTADVEAFLTANSIPFEVHTSSEFATLDFSSFGMIVFSGDQPQSFYDAYATYVDKFEEFVEGGGFLNFFACDAGWNGGTLSALLPGGMTWTGWIYENYNNIDDPAHPVVAGVPNPFYGNYASHGHFTTLPDEAHVIASEQSGLLPTIVEYPFGAGWVIAFGQPLEISHNWGWDAGLIMENTLLWGNIFQPALDVPWLAEAPITGTLAHDSSLPVDVTFTAFPTMTVGGVYTAFLNIKSDDPLNGKIVLPVTMNVVAPAYGVEVSADQAGSGEPGDVLTYTVTVTNTSNFATDSFTVTLGTHVYPTTLSTEMIGPLAMGETVTFMVTVAIPADAVDGDHDTVQITVTSVGDPTKTAMTNVTTDVYVSIVNIYLPLIWKVYP